eukprot:TRINITY_DN1519_c1_g1_i1.p2 TRINITY_DN1519_c1_g1~~TRINITY_DN1519_c1_g1_i1.p2  ORF type:complete len:128 (-),score=20.26 TRINITY_DN1519_c1_g1_i1:717-1100(-)
MSMGKHKKILISFPSTVLKRQKMERIDKRYIESIQQQLDDECSIIELDITQPCQNLSQDIEDLHLKSIESGQNGYIDESIGGYYVMNAMVHIKRGKCCGNKCRHCPYEHENVESGLYSDSDSDLNES